MKQFRYETYYLRNILQLAMLILSKTVFIFFGETIETSRLRAARGVYTVSGEIYMDLLTTSDSGMRTPESVIDSTAPAWA